VLTWFFLPTILKHYINRLKPGVEVDSVRLISLDCVKLGRVHVKLPTIEGTLDSAVACRKAKTIDIDGGLIIVDITNEYKDQHDGSGFKVTAKNLTVKLVKGLNFAKLYNTTVDTTSVNASSAKIETKYGVASLVGVHYYLKDKLVAFDSGSVGAPDFLHKVSDLLKLEQITFTKGIIDVPQRRLILGSVSYPPITLEGLTLEFDNGLIIPKAKSIQIEHKRFYWKPVTFQDVAITPIDPKNPTMGQPEYGDDLWVKSKNAHLYFNWATKRLWGAETCQDWFDAIPDEMKVEPLPQVKLTGDFTFAVTFAPEVKLHIMNTCKLAKPTPKFIRELEGEFSYVAYHPNGKPFERKSGPQAPDWTPYQMISPNMTTALTTTEDPGFFYHRGFIPQAIENSLKDNLKLGKFFRGGSTLSMQLAKNLWLNRSRTIGRKIQEAILTVALESSLPKDKIIELYLNIVEYGPDMYGIGPASYQILKKDPLELSLSEALYLVLRLPRPNHSASYEHDKPMIKKLLDMVAASGKVPEDLVEVEKSALDGAPMTGDTDD
jgi:hypothetical protein